jgi:hypothetical protein
MARILIIRFSALGDVAMTIPVIHSLAVQYPQHEITVLSRAVWQPLFQSLPENVNFVGAVVFSVIGILYLTHRGKGKLAASLIPQVRDTNSEVSEK